ncbi:MAG: hypothetical protein K2H70_02125, partial [Bacteroidales bacterium]|nr:hypothetical protein [Bacteroidales bacterium]
FYFTLVWLVVSVAGWLYQKNNPIEGEIVERKRAAALSAVMVYFLLFFCLIKAAPAITTVPLLLPAAFLCGDFFTRKKETLLSEGLFLLFVVLGLLCVWL